MCELCNMAFCSTFKSIFTRRNQLCVCARQPPVLPGPSACPNVLQHDGIKARLQATSKAATAAGQRSKHNSILHLAPCADHPTNHPSSILSFMWPAARPNIAFVHLTIHSSVRDSHSTSHWIARQLSAKQDAIIRYAIWASSKTVTHKADQYWSFRPRSYTNSKPRRSLCRASDFASVHPSIGHWFAFSFSASA